MIWNKKVNIEYWAYIITWIFWSGKTKNTYLEAFYRKQQNPYWIVISNIPYKDIDWNDLVDIHFNSKSDLTLLTKYLFDYLAETNLPEILKVWIFPPIFFILDEAHLYYFSRSHKDFDVNFLTLLTQCRKRLVTMYYITQELAQLDKQFRRLSPNIYIYSKWFWFWKRIDQWWTRKYQRTYKSHYYMTQRETTVDIENAFNSELIKETLIRPDPRRLFFNKKLKAFFDQKYLTNYICGSNDVFFLSYWEFLNILIKNKNLLIKQMEYEKYVKIRWNNPNEFEKRFSEQDNQSNSFSWKTEETNKGI